ncbi:hypothetical protein Q6332_28315, partial [Klebsiella pneumoniae]|uniref:hypothetical protein n=1 Tax=Klebsiella pneumoniae TaxID=573 RepID=UPI00272F2383
HLFTIDQYVGNARVVVAHQVDATLAFGLDQLANALQHFVHVGHCQGRQLVGALLAEGVEQLSIFDVDTTRAHDLLDNLAQRFGPWRAQVGKHL